MFIRNSWYVAAWSDGVGINRPLARTVLNEPLVLFRTGDGTIAVLEDRCAHRRMPLSNGKLVDDLLVCCYHGLTYDKKGQCVRVPGQASPPANISVRSYPAVERYGAIWVWMGERHLADSGQIFTCDLIDDTGSNSHKFYYHVKANYLYLNDNLSDLLHQAYLHDPSFGGNANPLAETIPAVKEGGQQLDVRWDWENVTAPGLFARVGHIGGQSDGWNYSVYQVPSFYINDVGFADARTGKQASKRPQGAGKLSFTVYQLLTPESSRSTHFFKIVTCDWPAQLLPELPHFIDSVNQEDIWACEEQQRMEDLDPKAPMAAIPTDRSLFAMRRMLGRALQDEGHLGGAELLVRGGLL